MHASSRFQAKIVFKAAEWRGALARSIGCFELTRIAVSFCPNAVRYFPARAPRVVGSGRSQGDTPLLSGLWIALAVIFVGGERAAHVALALLCKLPHPFRARPAAAQSLKRS